MAMSIHGNSLPSFADYDAALRFWEKAKPWRDGPYEYRPLGDSRRMKHFVIRQKANGDVACRYHSTDVVTFHPDGTLTVKPWNSLSTDIFARRMLPCGISTSFNSPLGALIWLWRDWDNRRGYLVPHSAKLVRAGGGWTISPDTPPEPIAFYKVDKSAAAKALRAYRYFDFLAWRQARVALDPRAFVSLGSSYMTNGEMLSFLRQGPEGWAVLSCLPDKAPKGQKKPSEKLRHAIYSAEDCIECEKIEALTGYDHEKAVRAAQKAYQYL